MLQISNNPNIFTVVKKKSTTGTLRLFVNSFYHQTFKKVSNKIILFFAWQEKYFSTTNMLLTSSLVHYFFVNSVLSSAYRKNILENVVHKKKCSNFIWKLKHMQTIIKIRIILCLAFSWKILKIGKSACNPVENLKIKLQWDCMLIIVYTINTNLWSFLSSAGSFI